MTYKEQAEELKPLKERMETSEVRHSIITRPEGYLEEIIPTNKTERLLYLQLRDSSNLVSRWDAENPTEYALPVGKDHLMELVIINNRIKRENTYAMTGFAKNDEDVKEMRRLYSNARQRYYYQVKKAKELSETKHRTAEDAKRLNSA